MNKRKPDLEARYANRRKKILRRLKGQAALFSAAPDQVSSRDLNHPYRQDSDFRYLTGLLEPCSALLLLGSTRGPRSVLFIRDRDAQAERWVGERIGITRAKRRFRVDEVRDIASLKESLIELLTSARVLHYGAGTNPDVDNIVWDLFRTPVGPRSTFPHTLADSRLLTSELRVVKDRDEIKSIRHAIDITSQAYLDLLPLLKTLKSERHAASVLESLFTRFGAHGTAFPTIFASGRNATVLHHTPSFQPLWKRELVLIDAGAEFNGYGADITRTLPVSGKFSEPQAAVYDAVWKALQAGISRAAPGASLDSIHQTVVRSLCASLVSLEVLQGTTQELIQKKAYLPYYMHKSGHWLGADVHDISPLYCEDVFTQPRTRPLEPGNVFTIEPGLYFDPKDRSLPEAIRGIGVRIEEDILITNSGCEVLTSQVPSARQDIEDLMVIHSN